MTASSSPDPATPQWTWTDEAREELRRALGLVYPPTSVAEWRIDAVLAVLAPHVARQVADLTAEVKRLRIALATVNTSFDAVSAREAIRSELINQGLAAAEQVDTLRRQVAGLEAENDNYHADLIRVIGERDAALAALAELVQLKDGPRDAEYERRKPFAWAAARRVLDGQPDSDTLAVDSQRPVLPPEDAREPRTPAPESPGTPGTLSVPLSAPQDPHGA